MQLISAKNVLLYIPPSKPKNFMPTVEVAICFLEVDGKILLLKSCNKSLENNKWGVPGGKLNTNETPIAAIKRELFEETGIYLVEDDFIFKEKMNARIMNLDFILYIYQVLTISVDREYSVLLDFNEHNDYKFLTPQDCLQEELIASERQIIKFIYGV